jgi:C-terminal peptidase prc
MKKILQKTVFILGSLLIIQCNFLGGVFSSSDSNAQDLELFYPLLDTSLQEATSLRVIASKSVEEGEAQVLTTVRSRTHPNWNDSLEQLWNLFMLESFSIYQEELQAADKQAATDILYESIGDRYTGYIPNSSAQEYLDRVFTTSTPGAIGVRLDLVPTGDTVKIIQVAPNSPASIAGIEKRDLIVTVNGASVVGDSALSDFREATKGDSGTALTLGVHNESGIRTVSLVKDQVDFPSVLIDTVDGNGVIRVFSFTPNTYDNKSTADEFIEALQETSNREVTILDFRGNPGGVVSAAIEMSDALLSSGTIIQTKGRALYSDTVPRNFLETYTATSSTKGGQGRKYILLANKSSASASEMFISAIMEGLDVPMVGDTTFGKGVGQVILTSPDGGVARITFSETLSRNGVSYNGAGIAPTHYAPDSAAFDRALELSRELRSLPLSKKGSSSRVFNGNAVFSEGEVWEPLEIWEP